MIKKYFPIIVLVICFGALNGCTDKDVYNPDRGKTELKPENEYFDFATTARVDFNIDYGKLAGYSLLNIFTEIPMIFNEDGSYTIKGEPVYKIFMNEDGLFKGQVELPKSTKKVYIYSPSWGAPMCMEGIVENGKVTISKKEEKAVARTNAVTRANSNLSSVLVDKDKNVYSIVKWDASYGKINDVNGIVSNGSLTGTFIRNVQYSLWKGKSDKPGNLDNKNLVQDTKHVNTTIVKAYINDKGQTVTITDAELYLTFLTESGLYQSTLGYYYYKTGEAPTNPKSMKKFVIIPNASIPDNQPYTDWRFLSSYNPKNAPMSINTKFQLLYEDENGKLSTKFPAGYTIGYFLIPDGYNISDKKIDSSKTFIYSDMEWNEMYAGEKARFISLSTSNGTVVYGVEDGADKSYEDVLFCIDSNPNEAIQDPDRPVIDPVEPEIKTTETTYRTFAYEDIWPQGGDYDLNDVIIEHKREVSIVNNYVAEVKDSFTPIQKEGAAVLANAFAIQYDASQRGTIKLPTSAVDEKETSSVILAPDVRTSKDQPLVVTRTFDKGSLLKANLKTDLNPFIIVNYAAGANYRTEVHLPKAKATTKANPAQIGHEDDAYYINKGGKYPFAIMIPGKSSGEGSIFIPAVEKISIDKEYPDFNKWVESKGTTNNDWYLYYRTSKQ